MSAKAKYEQVYEWLEQAIANGEYKVGDRLPNEIELAERFSVHRMTIRQAVNKLAAEHLVVRKRGSGTYLLSDKRPVMVKSLDNLTTYRDDIMQAGLLPKYKLLSFARTTAGPDEAEKLQIAEGVPILSFSRIMYASGTPLVWESTLLPDALYTGLEAADLEEPLYFLMREKFNQRELYTEHEIGCEIPDLRQLRLLQLPEGSPCLSLYSVSRDGKGTVVEFSSALHRGDKYRFKCTIQQYILSTLKNGK